MKQITDPSYAKFSPQERLSLTMAALARSDQAEANRLWETCPWRPCYTMDMEYTQRMHALFVIESLFFQKIVLHYNMAQKAEKFIMTRECDLEAEQNHDMGEWVEKTQQLITAMSNARDGHLSNLKEVIEGFRLFCTEAGINYDDVAKALPLNDCCPDIDWLLTFDVPVNDEHIQAVKSLFLEGWEF